MTALSPLYKKTNDAMQVLKWKVLLAKKMEELNCEYDFRNKVDFVWDDNACMNITDPDFQPVPIVIVGYIANLEDNYLQPNIIAHEIGHVIDLKQHKHSLRYLQKTKGTLEMEVVAWEHAFRLLRQIGWTDFKETERFAIQCLKSYFSDKTCYIYKDCHFGFTGENPTWKEAQERISIAHESAKSAIRRAKLGY